MKKTLWLALIFSFIFAGDILQAQANESVWTENYISTSPEDIAAWTLLNRPGEEDLPHTYAPKYRIYYKNGEDTVLLTDKPGYHTDISTAGNYAAWGEYWNYISHGSPGPEGIYVFDGNNVRQLSNWSDRHAPKINVNGQVLWGRGDVMLWDGSSTKQLTTGETTSLYSDPLLNSKGHVLLDTDEGLYFYDGTSKIKVANSNNGGIPPKLTDDDVIVYQKDGQTFSYYNGQILPLNDYSGNDSNLLALFDNSGAWNGNGVQVTPEPASMLLFGVGGATLALLRKRRKINKA